MKVRLLRDMHKGFPKGMIVEHPDVFRLVRMGVAEAMDEECKLKADRTPEHCAAAGKAYEKVSRGIASEDYEAFDRGEMVGYDADGNWIPGPNYEGETESSDIWLPEQL